VVYYQSLGFSGTEIGFLTGLMPLVTFVGAPFWTRLADATHKHRLIMSATFGLGIAGLAAYPLFRAFAPLLLLGLTLNFFISPTISFADNATMFMLGTRKDLYGRVRLGGTIGFGLAAPLAGALIQHIGLRYSFWIASGLYFLAFLVSGNFAHPSSKEDSPAAGGFGLLLKNPRWIIVLSVAFAGGLALAAANNYLFPFMKELGADESLMGIALSIGTIIEFPVLFFGNRLIRRFKAFGLFMMAMTITGIRLVLFGLTHTPELILLIQLLNGLSFPAMWMAGVAFAYEHAPAGMRATAQGVFAAMFGGIGIAAGGFLGGPLLELVGGHGLFLIFGGITLAVVAAGAIIEKLLPKEEPIATEGVGSTA
jgi:PPP family 3-phenylpropionic acid transporter